MKILPKFISKEANVCDLEEMELGRPRTTTNTKHSVNKALALALDDKHKHKHKPNANANANANAGVERSGTIHRRDVRVTLGNLNLN